jgi:hypothetical protein
MIEIAAFTTAVSHATNIAKAIVETHDELKLRELKLEFATALLDVTQKQLALAQEYQAELDANKKLKQQLAAYERWEQESQRYQLHQPSIGVFVYALKQEHAAGQPLHWICAACYDDGKKSLLQRVSKDSNAWACPRSAEHHIDFTQYGDAFSR